MGSKCDCVRDGLLYTHVEYRSAVYYKPRAPDRPNDLSWMVLALNPSQYVVIPLRAEGTPPFSARDRKLIPLEVGAFGSVHVTLTTHIYEDSC